MKQPITRGREAERIWLAYFNRTLCSQGLITERQRDQLAIRIRSRDAAQDNQKRRP